MLHSEVLVTNSLRSQLLVTKRSLSGVIHNTSRTKATNFTRAGEADWCAQRHSVASKVRCSSIFRHDAKYTGLKVRQLTWLRQHCIRHVRMLVQHDERLSPVIGSCVEESTQNFSVQHAAGHWLNIQRMAMPVEMSLRVEKRLQTLSCFKCSCLC